MMTQSPEALEYTRQIKEKLKAAEYLDLEGRSDDKIRIMEVVHELQTKRADKQAMSLLEAFNKDRSLMPQPLGNPPPLAPLPTLVTLPPDARTQEMIKEKLKKAEELGELGMVDEAQKAMEEAEALKKLGARQEAVTDPAKLLAPEVRIADQKLRVCDICGAFLSIYDSDRRLADHFGGKLHLGYMQIREKLVDLRAERSSRKVELPNDEKPREPSKARSMSRDREKERDADRERTDREKEKEAERERERDRERERSRGREKERGRDYRGGSGRDRERERDRGRSDRDYDSRSRRRSRSRSRERSRDRDRSDRYRRHDRYDRY
ncbi:hypothetical protein KC19_5G154600 [Ceratodon purpureus]|uniref:Uncharacterized protein n=1 Tax=Ceratodon purpureus TaxID=3225 RepID=A0A8T0I1U6_CERPU|nr:hypothetical protein KC19_5G154600 [Ceratodon purpureus]